MPPKRNVAYIKPDEPAFLKRIKQEIGYKELEDEIDMKRGPIQNLSDDDDDDEKDDEKPQVVQLKKGDLTEEEAKRILKEEEEKPADLNQKIIFKVKRKKDESEGGEKESGPSEKEKSGKSSRRKGKPTKSLLSFEEEDE